MTTNKTPAVGCGIVIVLLTGWLVLYVKKECGDSIPAPCINTPSVNCSKEDNKNILCPNAKLESGVFEFGQITLYLCDPFEKAERYSVFINGEEALKVNWKNESVSLAAWITTCVETNSICCVYGGRPSVEICFIDNGNLSLKTDRNLYTVSHREGKYLLHFLVNPIS
jgi:hypothetical protein